MRIGCRRAAIVVLSLGLAVAMSSARAQPAASPPAAAIDPEQQLRLWITDLTGLAAPQIPLRITPDGDHYRIVLPWHGLVAKGGDGEMTGSLRIGDGGKWLVDNIRYSPQSHIKMALPSTSHPGQTVDGEGTLTVTDQDGHLVIDPNQRTVMQFDSQGSGIVVDVKAPGQNQHQEISRYGSEGTVVRTDDGRYDSVQSGSFKGWRIAMQLPDDKAAAVEIGEAAFKGNILGINRDRIRPVVAGFLALSAASKDDEKAIRAALHQIVEGLRDGLRAATIDESAVSVRVDAAGMQAMIDNVRFAAGGDAPNDTLSTWIEFELAGLAVPALPPSFTTWLPKHVLLRPTLSGVGLAQLTQLALAATGPDTDPRAIDPQVAAIFGPGVRVGIEKLVVELANVRLDGSGQMLVHGPDSYDGTAHLTLQGFDALLARANAEPALQQAVPVLVLVRGLAKPEQDRLVWDVASDGQKVTINGVDAATLLGGAGPTPPAPRSQPAPGKPPAPHRPQPGDRR